MRDNKVTYERIARKSGVSPSSISRVLNKSPYVTEKTRIKVIKALEEHGMDIAGLDLSPAPLENLIIFNVPSLLNPFYSPIATAARIAANNHGYSLYINEDPLTDDTFDSFRHLLKKTKAVGLILSNSIDKKKLDILAASLPVVSCCESGSDSKVPFVSIDDNAAAVTAVRHLLALGKRRVALINGPLSFKYARARYEGYEYALEKSGIQVDESIVAAVGADMNYDQAKDFCLSMLSSENPPDAFFCVSDVLAAAAIKASIECNKRVPEDIAVVGFDDIMLSRIMIPSISTVRQPTDLLGSVATNMLIKIIEGDKASLNSLYLPTELIIRASSKIAL